MSRIFHKLKKRMFNKLVLTTIAKFSGPIRFLSLYFCTLQYNNNKAARKTSKFAIISRTRIILLGFPERLLFLLYLFARGIIYITFSTLTVSFQMRKFQSCSFLCSFFQTQRRSLKIKRRSIVVELKMFAYICSYVYFGCVCMCACLYVEFCV